VALSRRARAAPACRIAARDQACPRFGRTDKLKADKGGRDGIAGYSYRYDEWAARPAPTEQRRWRRWHVADHDGAARATCLQGAQGPGRAGCACRRTWPTTCARWGTVAAGTPGGGLDELLGGLFGRKPGNVPASTGAK